MIREENLIKIGQLFKPHGFKGEIKAEVDFDPSFLVEARVPVFVYFDGIPVPYFLEAARGKDSAKTYLKLKRIDSETQAMGLCHKGLYAEKAPLAEALGIDEDELAIEADELVGFEVWIENESQSLGSIIAIEEGKEYDYAVVKPSGDSDDEIRIPLIDEFITDIVEPEDDNPGRLTVDLPEGFLEI